MCDQWKNASFNSLMRKPGRKWLFHGRAPRCLAVEYMAILCDVAVMHEMKVGKESVQDGQMPNSEVVRKAMISSTIGIVHLLTFILLILYNITQSHALLFECKVYLSIFAEGSCPLKHLPGKEPRRLHKSWSKRCECLYIHIQFDY